MTIGGYTILINLNKFKDAKVRSDEYPDIES